VVLPGGGPTVRGDGERTPRARCGRGRGRGQQQHSRASPRPGRARTIESSAYAPGGHRPSPPRVRARTHATMGPLCPPGTGPNTTRHAGARPLLLLLRAPGAHRLEELCRRALCRTDFRHWFRTTHQKHTPVVSTSARQALCLPHTRQRPAGLILGARGQKAKTTATSLRNMQGRRQAAGAGRRANRTCGSLAVSRSRSMHTCCSRARFGNRKKTFSVFLFWRQARLRSSLQLL